MATSYSQNISTSFDAHTNLLKGQWDTFGRGGGKEGGMGNDVSRVPCPRIWLPKTQSQTEIV